MLHRNNLISVNQTLSERLTTKVRYTDYRTTHELIRQTERQADRCYQTYYLPAPLLIMWAHLNAILNVAFLLNKTTFWRWSPSVPSSNRLQVLLYLDPRSSLHWLFGWKFREVVRVSRHFQWCKQRPPRLASHPIKAASCISSGHCCLCFW